MNSRGNAGNAVNHPVNRSGNGSDGSSSKYADSRENARWNGRVTCGGQRKPLILDSEGQRLLLEQTGSVRALAARAGVPKTCLGEWRRATSTPGPEHRECLRQAFGIEPRAWDRAPTSGHGGPVDPLSQALLAVKSAAAELTEALEHALEVLP